MHRHAQTCAPTRARHILLAFTLALTGIAYLDRVCVSTAKRAMVADLHLSDLQMGYVFSAFTLAYALFEVPSGWLVDRFGPRLMLARIVLWWSLMTALTGWAGGFASLFVIRLLFGMGEAGTFPGIARAFSRWLPSHRHGAAFGFALTAALLTGAFTQPLVVKMLGMMHWRWTFPVFALVGVVWAVAWFVWFRDDPHQHAGVNEAELALIGSVPPESKPGVPWRRMFRSRELIAACAVYFGIIYGWYFYLTWMPDYLQRARGFDPGRAAWLSGLSLMAMAASVFFGGILSDALRRRWGLRVGRRACGLVTLPLAAVSVCAAAFTTHALTAAILLAVTAGLASLSVASCWALTLDIGGSHSGVVSGAMNTFGNLGGALSPVVVGHCVQRWSVSHPWHAWHVPMFTMAAFYLLSAACWWLIDASKPITGNPACAATPL